MSKFRKIDTRIWNDQKFMSLSERARLVFFFNLTHPNMTSLGAMRASIPGMAAEFGVPEKDFREAFQEVLLKGMIEIDEKASFVCLPKFIFYNKPENPNCLKAYRGAIDLLPECDLKDAHIQRVKAFVGGLSKGFVEVLPEVFGEGIRKGMPNREPEPEPEQEIKNRHLDFVFLTDQEHLKLTNQFGPEGAAERIGKLNSYIGRMGEKKFNSKYDSHFFCIMSWYQNADIKEPDKSSAEANPLTDTELKTMKSSLKRKKDCLDACGPDDPRREELERDIVNLTLKIAQKENINT